MPPMSGAEMAVTESKSLVQKDQLIRKRGGQVVLKMLQLNAETLQSDVQRIGCIDRLARELGIGIACFQETQTKGPSIRLQPGFLVAAGGRGARGVLGCEVWVAKKLALKFGKEVVITKEDVAIASCSERHVAVALRHP